MPDNSPKTPDLPNASIDFNKLHAAAIAGELKEGIPAAAIVIGEQQQGELVGERTGGMLTEAADDVDVQANIAAATPAERAAMAEVVAPLVVAAQPKPVEPVVVPIAPSSAE